MKKDKKEIGQNLRTYPIVHRNHIFGIFFLFRMGVKTQLDLDIHDFFVCFQNFFFLQNEADNSKLKKILMHHIDKDVKDPRTIKITEKQ
jgi:hypothetical protein